MRFDLKYLLVFTIFLFSQCAPSLESQKKILGQNNAIWCESIYLRGYRPGTHEYLTDDITKEFARTLKAHHIKYAYLFAGPFGKDGHLPRYPFSDTALRTVQLIKKNYPQLLILPWIGGVQNKTVFLGATTWVNNALKDTKKLVAFLNVPGVHVDLEYIQAGDAYLDTTIQKEKPGDIQNYGNNVNDFHKKLRALLPNSFISSVVVATSPDTKPWKRKTTMKELKQLTKYIDQLSFLYYDTYIKDEDIFERNCDSLVTDIQSLKKINNIQYLIAIGTFINVPELHKYRDLKIENISNSLQVIKGSILRVNPIVKTVDGIAIFCDWETDSLKWEQIDENWTRI
ncbi:hypothetical protein KXD93_22150 [Mucilaginibacter sp. BJC16-A38]|uniref:glycosyl hydrolase family 18 protein n=1 Tax=Mucilaginibacter phenanthrenivorans TaxID=1234842 RepID=UPI002157940A|nr:glycosyl hydrolase family 18 protein [Mucilaginibacter phenanthrenivorans]MCR8560372.1 hypothetical protein [Mucilaginibacter phenanthrenivorans]